MPVITLSEKDTYYVQFHSFQQYLSIKWKQLVSDASELGIQIIGALYICFT